MWKENLSEAFECSAWKREHFIYMWAMVENIFY